jgi:hypothetical protein
MKAQDILNHCEAVVEGRKQSPAIVARHVISDAYEIERFGLSIVIHYSSDDAAISAAALLLGLDKPEVVLEWTIAYDGIARFNECLSARFWRWSERTNAKILLNESTILNADFQGEDRDDQARAWCAAKITEITTQTPKQ